MRLRRGLTLSLTLAVTLAAAPPAHAHLMNTGFGPFYDGLTHLFLTPEDLLPVVALALWRGCAARAAAELFSYCCPRPGSRRASPACWSPPR